MGVIPECYTCDLCQAKLQPGTAVATLTVPLSRADRELARQAIELDVPPALGRPTFGAFVSIEALVPNAWSFLVCLGCVDGLLPMMRDLKTQKVREVYEARAAARQRAARMEEE